MKLGYILIYVDDVERTMQFYENAFGLQIGFLHESKQYGEMRTGESKLGFVQHETAEAHGFEYQKVSLQKNAFGAEIGLVVPSAAEVESAFRKALQAGATALSAPTAKPWGQVVSYVRDCNGYLVEICSEM